MIPPLVVLCLGLAQMIAWGTSYYLIGAFGTDIAADLGWSRDVVYGGFSAALLVMGLTSPLSGRLIDRYGGRPAMAAGSVLSALACAALAACRDVASYYAIWLALGVAMRLTLYDAAFAALARAAGPAARGPMAQITLFGGLASTVFWPLGHLIAAHAGWRGAVLAFAGFSLLAAALNLALPAGRYAEPAAGSRHASRKPLAVTERQRLVAGLLYAAIATLANFLNAGMSSHMIGILTGLGIGAGAAVWIGTLRGIGQSVSRLGEVLFGRRLHPLTLNVLATSLLPVCFAAGLFSGLWTVAALVFAFVYGAGNGVLTITRGTLPLVLFDPRTYGSHVGRLLVPSFVLPAAAPLLYAIVIERYGEGAALWLSLAAATLICGAAAALWAMFRERTGQD